MPDSKEIVTPLRPLLSWGCPKHNHRQISCRNLSFHAPDDHITKKPHIPYYETIYTLQVSYLHHLLCAVEYTYPEEIYVPETMPLLFQTLRLMNHSTILYILDLQFLDHFQKMSLILKYVLHNLLKYLYV